MPPADRSTKSSSGDEPGTAHPWVTVALVSLAMVFWGGTFIAGRALAPTMQPESVAFYRFLLASALLIVWIVYRYGRLPMLSWRQGVGVLLLGLTGVFAYNLFFFAGLQTVEAGRAALIIAINPVVIALASALFFSETLGARRLVGIGLSVAGASLVISRGDYVAVLGRGLGAGELYLLGCVLSWAAYTLIGRRLLHGLSPLITVTYASLAGTLLLGIAVLQQGVAVAGEMPAGPQALIGIFYLALFGTVLAFVWYYRAVKELGPVAAGQFINLVPVAAVVLGVFLLGEALTPPVIAGGLMVLSGLWLSHR